MFTGIVQASGIVESIEERGGDKRFKLQSPELGFDGVQLGDSICVNGVCLTVIEMSDDAFLTDVSVETLQCTTFKDLQSGARVNLEKSLTPNTAMGGHFVTGHVDGLGKVTQIEKDARSVRFWLEVAPELAKYIAAKGSVCIDGTSLTVNEVENCVFGINIIPHTFENTLFSQYHVGTEVNIEIDLVARYVERLVSFASQAN